MGTVYLHPPLPTVRQALMVQSKQTPSAVTQNRHQMRRWRREADMGDLKWVKYRPFIKNWRLFRLSVWNYLKLLPVEPLHLTSHFSADNCVEFFLHRTVSNTISNDFILSLSFCFLFFLCVCFHWVQLFHQYLLDHVHESPLGAKNYGTEKGVVLYINK